MRQLSAIAEELNSVRQIGMIADGFSKAPIGRHRNARELDCEREIDAVIRGVVNIQCQGVSRTDHGLL